MGEILQREPPLTAEEIARIERLKWAAHEAECEDAAMAVLKERKRLQADDKGPPMKPKVIEYDIGKDAYGRPVTLKFSRTYDGKEVWSITSDPVNQRDEGERMSGLTADNLRALAGAVS